MAGDVVRRVITQMGLDTAQYERSAQAVEQANQKMVQSGARVVDSTEKVVQRQTASSSAVDRVARSVDKGERAYHAYKRQLDIVNRAYQDGNITAQRHAEVTAKVEQNYEKASQASKRVTTATDLLRRAFIALGGAMVLREAIQLSDAYLNMTGRLRLVTNSAEELATTQGRLFDLAQRSRAGFQATTELYVRLAQNTRDLNLSQSQLIAVTETVNKAFRVSGATNAEAASATIQLSQAFASGALRGEEFNSINEQGPRIMQALADHLGVTRGALREMAKEGKITSEIMVNSLLAAGIDVDEQFAKLPRTFGEAFTQLQNQILVMVGGATLASGAGERLNEVLDDMRRIVASEEFAGGVGLIATGFGEMARFATDLVAALGKLKEAFDSGVLSGLGEIAKYIFVGSNALGGTGEGALAMVGGPNIRTGTAGTPYGGSFEDFQGFVGGGAVAGLPSSGSSGATKGFDNKLSELKAQAEQQERLLAAYRDGPAAVLEHEKALALLAKTQGLSEKLTGAERKALEGYLTRIDEAKRAIKELQSLKAAEARVWEASERAKIASISDPRTRQAAENAIERQKEINKLTEEYGNVATGTGRKLLEMWDKARASEQQAKFWDDVRKKAEEISGDITDFLIDGFVNAGEGGKSMFKNLWDGAMAGAKRFLANLAAEFLKQKLILPIVTAFVGQNSSLMGIIQPGGGTGSVAGVGNSASLFGGVGDLAGSAWSGVSGLFGGGGATAASSTASSLAAWTGGANSMAAGASATGGITAALSAIPVWGWFMAAASTVKGLVEGSDPRSLKGGISTLIGPSLEEWQATPRRAAANAMDPLGTMLTDFGLPSFLSVGGIMGKILGTDKQPSNKYAFTSIDTAHGDIRDASWGAGERSQKTIDASQDMAAAFLEATKIITELTGGTGAAGAFVIAGERDGYQVGVGEQDIGRRRGEGERASFKNAEDAVEWMIAEFARQMTDVADADLQKVLQGGGSTEELLENLSFVKAILDATAEAADPVATALKAVNDNFDLMEQRATDLGLSTELLTKLEAKRLEQIAEVNAGFSLGAYQGVAGALDQINNWMVAQQLSDTSSQNPLGRQALAQQEFEQALAAVQGGDLSQTGSLTSSASALLGIARANYGSTAGFTSIEQYVQSSLADVGQSIGSQQSMADQIAKAIQLSTQTNVQKQNEIIAAIEKLNRNIQLLADKAAA